MDCCHTENKSNGNVKGGKMEISKNTIMWIIIAVLLVATLFLTFKTSSIGSSTSTAQAAGLAAKSAASSSGMVGGC